MCGYSMVIAWLLCCCVVIACRKDLSIAQREWKKKKAQKKAQRLKQMEDEREQDKNKWIQFNTKVCHFFEFIYQIMAAFIIKNPIYPSKTLRVRSQIQICSDASEKNVTSWTDFYKPRP